MREVCTRCKRECESKLVNEGMGLVEAWGTTTVHEDWRLLSYCCNARVEEVEDEPEEEEEFDDEAEG